MKKSEILNTVIEILRNSLGVEDDEEIGGDTKIIDDLGAESIDFLDIMSRLERRFDVTIESGEAVEETIRDMISEEELETGIFPPEVIKKLPELMPEVDPSEFVEGLRFSDIPRLYTVSSMTYGVAVALQNQKDEVIDNDL